IIGVSVDAHGNTAYRMSLQTREQHIRREKATSNICTAQALLANMAGFYAVYHGPQGLTRNARRVHAQARLLERELTALGLRQVNAAYFDTLRIEGASVETVRTAALAARINLRYRTDGSINIALDETTSTRDVDAIVNVFAGALGKPPSSGGQPRPGAAEYPSTLARTTSFMEHPVFNSHHSETEMMRYIRNLERKDIGLGTSMIPLGSCTMKLNAASEMLPVTWPEFSSLHPFAPID